MQSESVTAETNNLPMFREHRYVIEQYAWGYAIIAQPGAVFIAGFKTEAEVQAFAKKKGIIIQ